MLLAAMRAWVRFRSSIESFLGLVTGSYIPKLEFIVDLSLIIAFESSPAKWIPGRVSPQGSGEVLGALDKAAGV